MRIMTRENAKEIIKETVITSIKNFAEKSLSKTPKFQILDLIIPKERKIRSIVGGLETSLGTTLWEPLAKELALRNGFNVIEEKLQCPANMPSSLNTTLHTIVDERKRNSGLYNASSSHDEIKRICQSFISNPIDSYVDPPRGRGVDIWLEKDGINYFFDTKTVQPNLSTLTGCLEQVLNWYAYFYAKNPTGCAISRIVFPYNPNPGYSFWSNVMGQGKPLEQDNEGWVEDQFWDFCSGLDGTYSIITESFIEIHNSGELEEVLSELLSNHN